MKKRTLIATASFLLLSLFLVSCPYEAIREPDVKEPILWLEDPNEGISRSMEGGSFTYDDEIDSKGWLIEKTSYPVAGEERLIEKMTRTLTDDDGNVIGKTFTTTRVCYLPMNNGSFDSWYDCHLVATTDELTGRLIEWTLYISPYISYPEGKWVVDSCVYDEIDEVLVEPLKEVINGKTMPSTFHRIVAGSDYWQWRTIVKDLPSFIDETVFRANGYTDEYIDPYDSSFKRLYSYSMKEHTDTKIHLGQKRKLIDSDNTEIVFDLDKAVLTEKILPKIVRVIPSP